MPNKVDILTHADPGAPRRALPEAAARSFEPLNVLPRRTLSGSSD